MNDLAPMVVCAIFVYGVYRLFELFVRRKERMAIIDKMLSNPIDPSILSKQFSLPLFPKNNNVSWPIRIGLLLVGLGIGAIIASIVDINIRLTEEPDWQMNNAISSFYFACIATFGGIGLVIAYFIDKNQNRKDNKEREE